MAFRPIVKYEVEGTQNATVMTWSLEHGFNAVPIVLDSPHELSYLKSLDVFSGG